MNDAARKILALRGTPEFRPTTAVEIIDYAAEGLYRSMPVELSVETCKSILEWNRANRPIRKSRVETYARDMANGRWVDKAAASIAVNEQMDLQDGQHRLLAAIQADRPLKCILVVGTPLEAFAVIDKGSKRTDSDTLAVAKEKNTTVLGTALSLLIVLDQDGVGNTQTITSGERLDCLRANPEIRESVNAVSGIQGIRSYGSVSTFAVAHYRMVQAGWDPGYVTEFFRSMVVGAGLGEKDPRLKLKNRLLALKGKSERLMVFALTVKAFNAHTEEQDTNILVWKASQEPLPSVTPA